MLARPTGCTYLSTSQIPGSQALYTTHLSVGYLPRVVASLRIRYGQLIRSDFHRLDCSFVGCSAPHSVPFSGGFALVRMKLYNLLYPSYLSRSILNFSRDKGCFQAIHANLFLSDLAKQDKVDGFVKTIFYLFLDAFLYPAKTTIPSYFNCFYNSHNVPHTASYISKTDDNGDRCKMKNNYQAPLLHPYKLDSPLYKPPHT